jgi:hypothetical protein
MFCSVYIQTRLVSSGIGIIACFLYNGPPGMGLGKGTNKFPVHMRYETMKRLLILYSVTQYHELIRKI